MELLIERLAGNITRLTPVGRWDIKGAETLGVRFSAATGSGHAIIVDMSKVEYLSSMGLRALVMGAKATRAKGAGLVLLSPGPLIAEVLRTAHIDQLIPVHHDLDEAQRALSA